MTQPCTTCRSGDLRWESADIYIGILDKREPERAKRQPSGESGFKTSVDDSVKGDALLYSLSILAFKGQMFSIDVKLLLVVSPIYYSFEKYMIVVVLSRGVAGKKNVGGHA